MFDQPISAALLVSAQLTLAVVAVVALLGLPLALWITSLPPLVRRWIEPWVLLPLVMPPTVLGFYFLVVTSPDAPLGRWTDPWLGGTIPFSFLGITLACSIASGPLAVRSMIAAIDSVDRQWIEAAQCLGLRRAHRITRVILPLARRGIVTGLLLTAAHTLGAFGVVLMVGGVNPWPNPDLVGGDL